MKKNLSICLFGLSLLTIFSCNGNTSSTTPASNSTTNNNSSNQDNSNIEPVTKSELIVYFSATNRTEAVANTLKEIVDCETFEIIPTEPYTSEDLNYSDDNCRANQEQQDPTSRPGISSTLSNIDDYNVVYLGFPIWWGTIPQIIYTFMDTYDLANKTVAPFCTSGGSGISTAVRAITDYLPNSTVTAGMRVSTSSAEDDLKDWLVNIGLSD